MLWDQTRRWTSKDPKISGKDAQSQEHFNSNSCKGSYAYLHTRTRTRTPSLYHDWFFTAQCENELRGHQDTTLDEEPLF